MPAAQQDKLSQIDFFIYAVYLYLCPSSIRSVQLKPVPNLYARVAGNKK